MDVDETTEAIVPQETVAYILSQELVQISSLLPSNRNRSLVVHALVNACGMFSAEYSRSRLLRVVRPTPADRRSLSHYHTRDYLDYVMNPQIPDEDMNPDSNAGSFGLEDDCPPFIGLDKYVTLVAGASLTAVDALKGEHCDIAIAWDGGRHHAQKSHASGFCYVADCVLSILSLKRIKEVVGRKPRVMYLDLDVHFSDAVSQAFYTPGSSSNSSQVLTLSVHHASPGFYPVSSLSGLPNTTSEDFDPFTLSLPLRAGASSATYARVWPLIEKIFQTFGPDYVVIQCGVDGLAEDPCATFNWSLGEEEGSLGWCISRIVERWPGKKLFLGGGGYNTLNAARAWAYLTSIILGNPLNLEDEIPDHNTFPMYAPSYTFNIRKGNMSDANSSDYLTSIENRYKEIITALVDKCSIETVPVMR